MIRLIDMDTIQIEITNSCVNSCSNCSRFVGLVKKPFFMEFSDFRRAVDSLADFPNMVGIQGGEPLLHRHFESFCEYALSKIPRERLGLWTTLPVGYEKYREIIVKTFGNIFINNHTRNDIYHHPFLIASGDLVKDEQDRYLQINNCFFQHAWSASVNPKGAFFCEMAASFSMLYPWLPNGWPVEEKWWKRTPKDYTSQIETFCNYCGGAMFLPRTVSSTKDGYNVSELNCAQLVRAKANLKMCNLGDYAQIDPNYQPPLAAYKDINYRTHIAQGYGIYLTQNPKGFNEPHLSSAAWGRENILSKYEKRY